MDWMTGAMCVPALPADCRIAVTPKPAVPMTLQARLRAAVDAAGGPLRVARMSGVSVSSVRSVLSHEPGRLGGIARIVAEKCGVQLDWPPHTTEKADPHRARIVKLGLHLPC